MVAKAGSGCRVQCLGIILIAMHRAISNHSTPPCAIHYDSNSVISARPSSDFIMLKRVRNFCAIFRSRAPARHCSSIQQIGRSCHTRPRPARIRRRDRRRRKTMLASAEPPSLIECHFHTHCHRCGWTFSRPRTRRPCSSPGCSTCDAPGGRLIE